MLEYDDGRLTPRELPELPPIAGPEALTEEQEACGTPPPPIPQPKAPVQAAGSTGVREAIEAADRRGTISAAEAKSYRRTFRRATRTRGRISRWRNELSAQINVLKGIAARGRLTGGRMPALFLQLRRNTEFWSGSPVFPPRPDIEREPCQPPPSSTSSAAGARITFEGSRLVFQYYPGAGLQLQPLANFGLANGLVTECRREPDECDRDGLRLLLSELLATKSHRGGFVTWEYWFHFSGGTPPWTSGMSQGTAIQALTRASEPSILDDKSYLKAARPALGAFRTRAPVGVRVPSRGGNHYVLYSFSPGLRVLNGFLQAITGLYDYGRVADNKLAQRLFKKGSIAARRELPQYDTGYWSLYSAGGALSTGGYHSLVTGFLGNLCQRVKGRFCTFYRRFNGYATNAPALVYTGRRRASRGRGFTISFRTNKPTCVVARIRDGKGRTVFRGVRQIGGRGSSSLTWVPRRRGRFRLTLTGRDPLKNRRVVKRSIRVG